MSEPERLFEDAEYNLARIRELLGWGLPAPTRPRRPSDDVWDALCAALKWTPEPGDAAGKKRVGRAVQALCDAHATPGQVRERASRYRQIMPTAMLTPESFVKHWSSLAATPGIRSGATFVEDPEPEGEPMADLAGAARRAMARLQDAMDVRTDHLGQV